MWQYEIRSNLKSTAPVKIAEERFREISLADRGLKEILGVEEKFHVLMENYAEFEQALFQTALQRVMFNVSDDSSIFSRHLIGRRLLNLLSSARLYLDALPQHGKRIFGNKSRNLVNLKSFVTQAYDGSLGYRVMEALRNYAQHRDLPVHILASRSQTKRDGGLSLYAVPKLDLLQLSQDQTFKQSVLAELSQTKEPGTLTLFVRDYIRELSKIHRQFRFLSRPFKNDWNSILGRALAEYFRTPRRRSPSEIWAVAKGVKRRLQKVDLFYAARSRGLEESTRRLSKIIDQNLGW